MAPRYRWMKAGAPRAAPGTIQKKKRNMGKTLFRQKPGPPGAVEKNYFLFRAGERWASWLGFLEGVLEPLHRIVIFDPGKKGTGENSISPETGTPRRGRKKLCRQKKTPSKLCSSPERWTSSSATQAIQEKFKKFSPGRGRDGVTGLETPVRAWKAEYSPCRGVAGEGGAPAGGMLSGLCATL